MRISTLICVHSTTEQNDLMFERALESIARQSRRPDELVVVLDECWDSTISSLDMYLDTFDALAIVEKPKKEGLAAAKNFGLQHVTGDWVTYCDADDEWITSKLELQAAFVSRPQDNPAVDFLFTESWDRDAEGVIRPNCFYIGQYQTNEDIHAALPHENVLCHGSAMIRTEALRTLGGYFTSRDVLGREDWNLWLRAKVSGFRFYKIPERLYIWSHGTSVAR